MSDYYDPYLYQMCSEHMNDNILCWRSIHGRNSVWKQFPKECLQFPRRIREMISMIEREIYMGLMRFSMENCFDLFNTFFPMLIFEHWTPGTMRRNRIEEKTSEIDGNFSRTFLAD